MKPTLLIMLMALSSGCATLDPQASAVHVIGAQHAAPTGCQDLGPLQLPGASVFTLNPLGNPNDDALRTMTATKGGDTFHYTSLLPLGGEAYRCKP